MPKRKSILISDHKMGRTEINYKQSKLRRKNRRRSIKKKKLPQREFPIMLVIQRPTGTINLNQWFKNRKNINYQNCIAETEGKNQNKNLTSKKWHCIKVERERKYIEKNKSVCYWRVERMRRGKVGVTNRWETWEEWIDCWIKGKC